MSDPAGPEAFDALMAARWSCRAFRPEPVPRATLEAAFATAQRTASWNNVQPWQVELLSGAARDALRAMLLERYDAGLTFAPHFPFPEAYEGVYKARRRVCGYQLYGAVGIERYDHAARAAQSRRNFELFDAPHVAVIHAPEKLGTYGAVDCGAYVTALMLALQSHGVATIAQAALATLAETVAAHLGLAEDRRMVCAVSLGWPDLDDPVNGYRTERASVAEAVSFRD